MIYLGLGTNIGDRKENLHKAISSISEIGTIVKISAFYESEAWGYISDNKFLNAVVALETNLSPEKLLSAIKNIEKTLGRQPKTTASYEDRPIDIDILFYGNQIFELPQLIVPHLHIQNRKFVLVPMAEIAPNFVHPILNKTIRELNNALSVDRCYAIKR